MSYLLTLLLSLLGLNSSPANSKTVDDRTFISQENGVDGSNGIDATDAHPVVHIAPDRFAAFFHS